MCTRGTRCPRDEEGCRTARDVIVVLFFSTFLFHVFFSCGKIVSGTRARGVSAVTPKVKRKANRVRKKTQMRFQKLQKERPSICPVVLGLLLGWLVSQVRIPPNGASHTPRSCHGSRTVPRIVYATGMFLQEFLPIIRFALPRRRGRATARTSRPRTPHAHTSSVLRFVHPLEHDSALRAVKAVGSRSTKGVCTLGCDSHCALEMS